MFHNASPIEVWWTGLMLSAIYPALMNLYLQVKERRALILRKVNHGAQFVAAGYVIVETLVSLIVLACLYIGIVATFFVAASPPQVHVPFLIRSLQWVLFSVGIGIVLRSWVVWAIHHKWHEYAKGVITLEDDAPMHIEFEGRHDDT